MTRHINNLTINKLKEISLEYSKILCNCTEALEKMRDEKFDINHKLTKENFENFLEKINSNGNNIDAEDYLIKDLIEIKEIFKDDINTIFPFYQLCDIQFKDDTGYLKVIIKIDYNYEGKMRHYKETIPLNENMRKHIASFEAYLNLLRVW